MNDYGDPIGFVTIEDKHGRRHTSLYPCLRCGAVVSAATVADHDRWHQQWRDAIKAASVGVPVGGLFGGPLP